MKNDKVGNPLIDSLGTKHWHKSGKLHREDGPAVISKRGTRQWYIDGNLHREDGPAIMYHNGTHAWYVYNYEYTFDDYCDKLDLSNEDKLLLKLKYE